MRSDLNVSAGDLVSVRRIENGVVLEAENCSLEIKVYAAEIFRVSLSRSNCNDPDFSYAVKSRPDGVPFNLVESPENICIETESLKLVADCKPVRLSFYDKNGALLSEEDKSFGTSWIGDQTTVYRRLQPCERFVGLGEKTGNLDRTGSAYTNWNTDHFAYPVNADPLYLSVPFFMGMHGGLAYGLFLDNSSRSVFNFGASNSRFSFFSAEFGPMRYFFIHGTSIRKIIEAYTWLTGRMPLPPIWSLGYQQCRYSYMTFAEVIRIAETFREKNIPCDVIYLDIHHMDAYKSFTWDRRRFGRPASRIRKLKKLGFRVVTILDPGIKVEKGYHVYESGKAHEAFLKYPDGEDYAAEVWPGLCVFPDFTNPRARAWWGRMLEDFIQDGVEGFWNDMNEPATWGQCVPELLEFDYDGIRAPHKTARNVYGLQMARSTYEGARKGMQGRRPFVLTRSGFAGVQNYAAVWTGDNVSSDDHMLLGARLINSLGLSGIAFAGNDVAGFEGEADPALFARWISTAVFTPFVRGHTMLNSRSAEPWSFGEEAESVAKRYIRLRYMLLPYIYSTFYECSRDGMPVCRSLAIDYAEDQKIYDRRYQHQYLFGESFLVAPVSSTTEIAKAYLPKGDWYDFYSDKYEKGPNEIFVETPLGKIPVFVKAGAVIPMQSKVGRNSEFGSDCMALHIYRGNADSSFVYYEDDGISFDYEKGIYYKREISLTRDKLVFDRPTGKYESRFKRIQIFFHGYGFKDNQKLLVNGKPIKTKNMPIRDFIPTSIMEPGRPGSASDGLIKTSAITIENLWEKIMIDF